MSMSLTRAFGLSMVVCLVAVLAAPALAAGPAHGRPFFPASRGTAANGLAGRGISLVTTLQAMGFPVLSPMALLLPVERAIERVVLPSPGNPVAVPGHFTRGPPWSANRTALPFSTAVRGVSGTREVGFAGNLTTYLGGKGYDVSDLNAALSNARMALAGSNLTAFGEAMRVYRSDLNAKITAGTLNSTVIRDYLKTLPVMHRPLAGRYVHARMMRGSWRSRW